MFDLLSYMSLMMFIKAMKNHHNKHAAKPRTTNATTAWPQSHRAAMMTTMLLFLLANMPHTPQADYVLKIGLDHYLSNTHTRVDGFCCETFDHIPCSMECDNSFLFCLQWSNQSTPLDDSISCPLGNYSTGNISRDDAAFPAGPGEYLDQGVPNPMLFKGASWPGSVKLYVQVDDIDPPDQSVVDSNNLVAQFDVLINISLGDNRTASVERSAPYSDRKFHGTFLFLSIELSCVEHFYGPECAKFCQPNNDERGHYSCDNSGNIICLEGFQNEAANCTECSLTIGCSSEGGYCNDTHHCICRESYTGENCEIDLDVCGHLEPCMNGASCINTSPGGYSCMCSPGFEGRNCSRETNECQPDTCKNGGICEDLHLAFVCTCAAGFTGQNCSIEINECVFNPCHNGGICQDAIGSYLCNCVNGFSGRNCDENPAAVSFAAVIGGGAVGLFLLILIALVLLVVLIWVVRQLKKERAIATAGDLEAREERGRTVSAVNPIHHEEHEADWEDMEQEMDEKKFINPAYEGVLIDQFVFEETELEANGGYSRLSSRMGSTKRQPQRRFVETSALTPHYSSLDLNNTNGSTATESGEQREAQDPKNHQYEDVDRADGEVKISNDGPQSRESSGEHTATSGSVYEDISIGKQQMHSVNDYPESCNYEEVGEFKQLQVEIEAEKGESDGKFEKYQQFLGVEEMQRNYSNDLELNQEADSRESLDDSEVEGTCV